MRRYRVFLLILITGCSSITDIMPNETFVRFYGDDAYFEVRDMISFQGESGQEFVILAYRLGDVPINTGTPENPEISVLSNIGDFYIIHVGNDGGILHEGRLNLNNLEINAIDDKQPSRIYRTDNGFLVIGSYVKSTTETIIWAELDQDFEMVGQLYEIGDFENNVKNYYGSDIALLSNGDVLVAGYNDINNNNDIYLTRWTFGDDPSTTETDEEVYYVVRTRQGNTINSDDRITRAFPLENGNFVVVGQTDVVSGDGESGINIFRQEYTSEMQLINAPTTYGLGEQTSDFGNDDVPYDAIERPGGLIVVGGSSNASNYEVPFFLSVDNNATSIFEQFPADDFNIRNQSIYSRILGVTRLLTNNYLVVGETDGFTGIGSQLTLNDNGKEVMYYITDQGGNRISEIFQIGLVNGNESGVRVVATTDGSAIIAANYDFGRGQQIALLKVNSNGYLKQ